MSTDRYPNVTYIGEFHVRKDGSITHLPPAAAPLDHSPAAARAKREQSPCAAAPAPHRPASVLQDVTVARAGSVLLSSRRGLLTTITARVLPVVLQVAVIFAFALAFFAAMLAAIPDVRYWH